MKAAAVAALALVLASPAPAPPSPTAASAPQSPSSAVAASPADAGSPDVVAAYADPVGAIVEEACARGRAHALLAELCAVAPHRLSGSEGAERAILWAEAKMRELGFDAVRREPCLVPRWVRGKVERLRVEAEDGAPEPPLPVLALGGSVGTPEGGVAGRVVAVTSFDELDARRAEVEGAIVLLHRPMDPGLADPFAAYGLAVDQRTAGASRAARHGARAVLVRSMTTRVDDVPHTGSVVYDPREPRRIPAAAISTRAAEALAARVAAGEPVRVRLELGCETLADVPSWNVVGELRGREPERADEIVLVGGHLDGWDVGAGAHDDGAGCAQSLEVVRLLKALDLRPRRTIRVVLFMNEENGLRGAHAYRETHQDELARHVLALESDRGGFAPRGFTCDGGEAALATVRAIADLLRPIGADLVVRGGGGADVGPLARDGVITAGLLPAAHRYFDVHHSERDVLAAVHPRELALGAAAMAALCYVVADLPEPLPRAR